MADRLDPNIRQVVKMHMAHEMGEWSNSSLHEFILDAVTAQVAILNGKGEIIAVNDAWVRFAEIHELALEDFGLGLNYLFFCDDQPSRCAAEAATGLRGLLAGDASPFRLEYEMPL